MSTQNAKRKPQNNTKLGDILFAFASPYSSCQPRANRHCCQRPQDSADAQLPAPRHLYEPWRWMSWRQPIRQMTVVDLLAVATVPRVAPHAGCQGKIQGTLRRPPDVRPRRKHHSEHPLCICCREKCKAQLMLTRIESKRLFSDIASYKN